MGMGGGGGGGGWAGWGVVGQGVWGEGGGCLFIFFLENPQMTWAGLFGGLFLGLRKT